MRAGLKNRRAGENHWEKSSLDLIAFTTLLARRLILLKWKSPVPPTYTHWVKEVLYFLKLEKIRLTLIGKAVSFEKSWNPFLSYVNSTSCPIAVSWVLPCWTCVSFILFIFLIYIYIYIFLYWSYVSIYLFIHLFLVLLLYCYYYYYDLCHLFFYLFVFLYFSTICAHLLGLGAEGGGEGGWYLFCGMLKLHL